MTHELCLDENGTDRTPAKTEGTAGNPATGRLAECEPTVMAENRLGSRFRGWVLRGQTFGVTVGVAFAIVFLQLAQGILLARLLGPEGRGEYATAVLYLQLLLYVGLLGGVEVICRYAADPQFDRAALRRSALWFGMTAGAITTVVVIVFNSIALPADKRYLMPLACLCSLSLVGQQVMLIMTAVDRGAGNFGRYNAQRVFAAAVFPALMLLVAPWMSVSPTIAGVLFVVSSLLGMVVCLVGMRHPLSGASEPSVLKLVKEGRPYFFSMLATDLIERLDLLLVLWLAPLVTQGLYAAMVPAVYPLTVIPNTLGLFLFNAGARNDTRLQVRDVNRILGVSLSVQATTTVVFMLLIGPVVRFVYGEDFSGAVIFALWLAPVAALRGIIQGLDSYLKGRGRPLAPINSRVASGLILLVGTFLLYPTLQTLAIPTAALASQVVCLVWLSAIVYADCRHDLPVTD